MSDTTATESPLRPAPDDFIAFARKHRATLIDSGRPEGDVQTAIKEIGRKCGYDVDYDVISVAAWKPGAGATSFAEYDEYLRAAQAESYVYEQTWRFRDIVDNVFAGEKALAEKATLIENAARDLRARLSPNSLEAELERGMKGQAEPRQSIGLGGMAGDFEMYKDDDGRYRWLAVFTNTFKDRDNEAISLDAHKDFVSWVDQTERYPSLRLWHTPGTDFGAADVVAVTEEGFVLASGMVDQDKEFVVDRLKELDIPLGCSHGFRFLPADLVDGVYTRYRTFEVSVLPLERAANEITAFFADKEEGMISDKSKRGFLASVVGEARVTALEAALSSVASEAKSKGLSVEDQLVAFKEMLTAEPVAEASKDGEEATAVPAAAPGGEAPAGESILEAVRVALAPLAEQITSLSETVRGLDGEVKALKQTDDERIAEAIAPRQSHRYLEGFMASTARETTVRSNDRAMEAVKDDQNPAGIGPDHLRNHLAAFGIQPVAAS